MRNAILCLAAGGLLAAPARTLADHVRYFEKDGITYRQTHRFVERPLDPAAPQAAAASTAQSTADRTLVPIHDTYAPPPRVRPVRDALARAWNRLRQPAPVVAPPQTNLAGGSYRTVVVPVTEYRWEAYWKGRWNPFVQPRLEQRLVRHQRWETRTEWVPDAIPANSTVQLAASLSSPAARGPWSTATVQEELVTLEAVASRRPGTEMPPPITRVASRRVVTVPAVAVANLQPASIDTAWRPSRQPR